MEDIQGGAAKKAANVLELVRSFENPHADEKPSAGEEAEWWEDACDEVTQLDLLKMEEGEPQNKTDLAKALAEKYAAQGRKKRPRPTEEEWVQEKERRRQEGANEGVSLMESAPRFDAAPQEKRDFSLGLAV